MSPDREVSCVPSPQAWQLCCTCNSVAGAALPLLVREYHLQCHNGASGGFLQLATGFCIGVPKGVVPGSSDSFCRRVVPVKQSQKLWLTRFLTFDGIFGLAVGLWVLGRWCHMITAWKALTLSWGELRTIVSHNDIWYAKPCEDCFELLYDGPWRNTCYLDVVIVWYD